MELSERLEACIAVEKLAAEIYHELAVLFPSERRFFKSLASSEEEHIAFLVLGKGYDMVGELPEMFAPGMSEIYSTIELAVEIGEKIRAGSFSLKAALEMSLMLEESIVEDHVQKLLHDETDSEFIAKLQKIKSEEQMHAESIRKLMASKGYLK